MKKKDIIFIIVLLIFAGGGYLIYQMFQGEKEQIQVYYDKELIDEVDISVDNIYTYQGEYGEFHLEVKDGKYRAVDVECPNHDCEKIGWVNQGSSQSIICAPNHIYVIQAGMQDQY